MERYASGKGHCLICRATLPLETLGNHLMISILPKLAPGHQVTIDGYLVPGVEVQELQESGQWNLMLDGRFGVTAESIEELHRWVWIVANAMAVGAGYSCHGENSIYRPNPYRLKVMAIGGNETTGTPQG